MAFQCGAILPDLIRTHSGGLSNLKPEKLEFLRLNKRMVLYPGGLRRVRRFSVHRPYRFEFVVVGRVGVAHDHSEA